MRYRIGVALGVLMTLSSAGHADPVTGKVVGPDDRPVAGAEVLVTRPRDVVMATTDAAGSFSFDLATPLGNGQFYASAVAHKDGLCVAGIALKRSDNVIRLSLPGTVSGIVQNAQGKPVAGAVVQVREVSDGDERVDRGLLRGRAAGYVTVPRPLRERLLVRSGADGRWTISYLPRRGMAVVMLKDTRYVVDAKTVAPDGVEPVALVAKTGTSVAGHVRYENGRPAAGIRVFADSNDDFVLSGADGAYRIPSLRPGDSTVWVEDPSGESAAPLLAGVRTFEGVIATGNDFALGPGSFLEGTIIDKSTGAPIAGLPLNVWYGRREQTVYPAPVTDARGHYRARVAPGTLRVDVAYVPREYLRQDAPTAVTLAPGETKSVDLRMTPGLKVQGVVVDEDGKPVAGLRFLVIPTRSGASWAKTDETGLWSAVGLPPGEIRLQSNEDDGARLVSPRTVTLPSTEPVTVTVKRLDMVSLTGRVVTNRGAPIPDFSLNLSITMKIGDNGYSSGGRSVATDAAGHLLVQVRAEARVSIRHDFAGYYYVSGGAIERKAGGLAMSDLVLAPLTGRVSGVVVNEAGRPVSSAVVMAVEGEPGADARTDDQGRFVLTGLPANVTPVTLLAAHGGHYAQLGADPDAAVTMRLAPAPATPGPDVERGYDLLKRLWEAGPQGVYEQDPKLYAALRELWPGTGGRFFRFSIPQMLAAEHPDLAWRLMTTDGNLAHDEALAQIIETLARQAPARAAAWAVPKLSQFQDPARAFSAKLALALALVELDPDQARSLYRESRDFVRAHAADDILAARASAITFARLALLAARLEPAESKGWADQALKLAKGAGGLQVTVVTVLIAADPAAVDTLLEPLQPPWRAQALADAAPLVARWDLAQATHILDLVRQADTTSSTSAYIRALISTIITIGPTHPAEALALATGAVDASHRSQALSAAVPFQPAAKIPSLVRDLVTMAGQSHGTIGFSGGGISFNGSDSLLPARLAALVYDVDPTYGKQLFAAAREHLRSPLQRVGFTRVGDPDLVPMGDVASFAYYYRRIDPAQSRMLLERAFAAANDAGTGQYPFDNSAQRESGDIVIAMASLDTARALVMAASLKDDDKPMGMRFGPSVRTEVLSKIGEFLLASEDVRRSHPFKGWASGSY